MKEKTAILEAKKEKMHHFILFQMVYNSWKEVSPEALKIIQLLFL